MGVTNSLAYYVTLFISAMKMFYSTGVCTIKLYGFVMNILCSKQVCSAELAKVTDRKTKILSVHFLYIMNL
jgi:hypothetical protein